MTPRIKVAGIGLCLGDGHLFKMLHESELRRLRPFLGKGASPSFPSVQFLFKTVRLESAAYPSLSAICPELLKGLKGFFPYYPSPRLEKSLDLLKKVYLPAYLARYGMVGWDKKRFLMSSRALIVYDQRTKKGVILYRALTDRQWREDDHVLNFLRMVYLMILPHNRDGIMLHASCVEIKGSGYVFVGKGHSGKSTAARLVGAERVLSDDCAVVRKNRRGYFIFPNPWWNQGRGEGCEIHPRPSPLKAVFFIKKSGRTALKRLTYKEAMALLIYNDHLFQQWGSYNSRSWVADFYLFAQELLASVPAFELRIKKSHRFRDEFRDLMKECH